MVWNHFEHLQDGPKGKVQDVLCKMPLAAKVFNRKKWLILESLRMYPFKLHSNGVLAICPKNKPFLAETLKAGKAVAEPPKI